MTTTFPRLPRPSWRFIVVAAIVKLSLLAFVVVAHAAPQAAVQSAFQHFISASAGQQVPATSRR